MKRVSLSLLALAATLPAMENPIVGPRALGMGGAQVACAEDYTAQYYNPAAFGFFWSGSEERRADGLGRNLEGVGPDNNDLARKDWGFGVDLGVGARINGDLATYANDLLDFKTDGIDSLEDDASGTNIPRARATIDNLLKLASSLGSLNIDRDAATVQANMGGGLRVLAFGVGARVYTEAVAKIADLDLDNLGSGTVIPDVAGTIAEATLGSTTPTGAPLTFFTQAQFDAVVAALGGGAAAIAAAEGLDQQATAANLDPAAAQAVSDTLLGTADGAGLIAALGGSGDVDNNQTSLLIQGAVIAEVPFTYGHAFNDYFAVGGSVKYMMGQVSGVKIRAIDTSSDKELEDYLTDFTDDAKESSNVGIDVGFMARYDYIQAGITARNINGPTFKGPKITYQTKNDSGATVTETIQIDDVQVKPDVRAGVAVIPFYTWYAGLTLAADIELMKSETALPGYYHQMAGAGAELKVLSTLDLRGGVSKNLAEDDVPMLIHGGLGLNLWLLRLDAAGAMANETVEVDGDEVPKEVRASFAVATDW